MKKKKVKMVRNFTLIELMIVITIITILVSIFLPALNSVKRKGEMVYCLSNMKQQGYAFQYYIDDYNGYYPNYEYSFLPPHYNCVWNGFFILNKYAVKETFICPSLRPDSNYPQDNINTITYAMKNSGYGIAYNTAGSGRFRRGINNTATGATSGTYLHISDVRHSSKMYFVMDSVVITTQEPIGKSGRYRLSHTRSTLDSVGNPDGERHRGNLNILYADSHAASKKVDIVDPYIIIGSGWRKLQWNGWADVTD